MWLWARWQHDEALATAPVPTLPLDFGVSCPGTMRALGQGGHLGFWQECQGGGSGQPGVWTLPHSARAACTRLSKGGTISALRVQDHSSLLWEWPRPRQGGPLGGWCAHARCGKPPCAPNLPPARCTASYPWSAGSAPRQGSLSLRSRPPAEHGTGWCMRASVLTRSSAQRAGVTSHPPPNPTVAPTWRRAT